MVNFMVLNATVGGDRAGEDTFFRKPPYFSLKNS